MRLNGYCTDYIHIKSGVKQRGIMYLMLYNIHVDDLMKLMCEKLGCSIGYCFLGQYFMQMIKFY